MTIDDFKFLHFAVLIFRFKTDACKNCYILPKKGMLSANKQYWALITKVCEPDEINTKPAIYVTFIDDSGKSVDLWIPIELFNDQDITIYPFRTNDEVVSYWGFLSDKVVERLEKFVVPYTKHSEAHDDDRYQSVQDRNQDIEVIKQVCEEEGLYDPDNHDTLDIEFLHWKPGRQYSVHYNEHGNGNGISFDVHIGGQILDPSDSENICTLPLEIKIYRDELRKFTETYPEELPEDGFPIIPYTNAKISPQAFSCPSDWLGKVMKIKWKSDDDYHGIDKATVKCFPNQYIKFMKDASMMDHMKLIPIMIGSITGDKTNKFNVQRLIGFMLSE